MRVETEARAGGGSALAPDHVAQFRAEGYGIVRGVFAAGEIAEIAEAFDRVYARAVANPEDPGHPKADYRIVEDRRLGRICRIAQWPAYLEPALARTRIDPRMLAILEPLLGDSLKQITSQLHWKPAGAERVEFGFHQDIRFRRPRSAFRDPGDHFIQTAVAVDPHGPASGGLRLYPGSHLLGELGLGGEGPVLDQSLAGDDLAARGLDPSRLVGLELAPGDLAFWGPFMVHGSGINRTDHDRRLFINGYVTAAACDLGEWAFRDGRPCPLEGAEALA